MNNDNNVNFMPFRLRDLLLLLTNKDQPIEVIHKGDYVDLDAIPAYTYANMYVVAMDIVCDADGIPVLRIIVNEDISVMAIPFIKE